MSKDSEKGKYSTPDGVATWEYASVACCALLIFSGGCLAAWTPPSLSILIDPKSPIPTTPEDGSNMAAIAAVGYMLAPIITILIVDRIGKKNTLMVGTFPLIISWGMIAVAKDVTVLIVARFLGGVSMGLTLCTVPMYLGEIASLKLRGAMGMICSSMINTGGVFMFVVVPHLSIQTMAIICLSLVTISAVITWFIPESPYFLAMRSRFEEAEISLEKLRGKTHVTEELDLIKATIQQDAKVTRGEHEAEKTTMSDLKRLFTVPSNRKSLIINLLWSTSLACGGYLIIVTYCNLIFEAIKAPVSPNASMIITALLQLIPNVLTTFAVERFGRKPLLCISGVGSGTCLFIVTVYFYLSEYTGIDVAPYSIYALGAIFINIIAVNIGLMPLQFVIQSEIIATDVKACTSSVIAIMGGFLTSIGLKAYIFLAVTLKLGHSVPLSVTTVITLLCTFFIMRLLPETKGKTFSEIQNSLRK